MMIELVKSKIHRVTVTGANLDYMGSISIDPKLLEASNIIPGEKVQVLSTLDGARLETYVIEGERGSGKIIINGPADLMIFQIIQHEERKIFLMLLSVSGIGASTGMMILSSLNSNEIRMAILKEDLVTLKSIKGIGMKSAQRIVIDLKDKMTDLQLNQGDILIHNDNIKRNEALSALETLGFSAKDINKVLDNILAENSDLSVEQVIKMSLKSL